MNKYLIFIIRTLVGAAFSILMMRMWFPKSDPTYAVLLAFILVGLAYLREYFYKRKSDNPTASGD